MKISQKQEKKKREDDDPTPTPKSHNVLIGSRESSPTHKNKENKIKHKTYKINTYIHKQTHSPKNTISPKQKQGHTYTN